MSSWVVNACLCLASGIYEYSDLSYKHSVHTDTIIFVHILFLIFRSASEVYKSLFGSIQTFLHFSSIFLLSLFRQTNANWCWHKHICHSVNFPLLAVCCPPSETSPTNSVHGLQSHLSWFSLSPPLSLSVSVNSSPPSSINRISVFCISKVYGLSKHV